MDAAPAGKCKTQTLITYKETKNEQKNNYRRAIFALPGRPQLVRGNSQLLFGGMGRLTEHSVISIKNKSHSVTADLLVSDAGAEGVIVAQGGMWGGEPVRERG